MRRLCFERPTRTIAAGTWALLGTLSFACLLACSGVSKPTTSLGPASSYAPPSQEAGRSDARATTGNQLELVFPYGSEKKTWLTEATERFNAARHQSSSGKEIVVRAMPMGSGESVDAILDGHVQAHLVSPASGAFISLGNAKSQAAVGKELVGPTRELVLSPVVIAMWRPMAEAIGWEKRPIGWSEILELSRKEEGWAAYGYPQWGKFKFGHTHPQYSNSGLISLFAEVYAATGKQSNLQLEDVRRPETAEFLREIELSVVHYGSSTGFFGHKLFDNGPTYLSAAVLYENMVIESYDRQKYPDLPFPVVAIYPKEGTFWSDHPVGIIQREWVTAEHQAAASMYIDFLLETEQQIAAMRHGFRPSDLGVQLTAPIDAAHGVDPEEPTTTLEVPPVAVMDGIMKLWHENKKHANVVVVLDTSGSMKGARLAGAKQGAIELINMLGDEDSLSLLAFSDKPRWIRQKVKMREGRDQFLRDIESLFAGGGTALYDATAEAHRFIVQHSEPDKIEAVVVLTDGADTNSRQRLPQLIQQVKFDGERQAIRVFTIGYGQEAEKKVLESIANESQARFSEGSEGNIREVFRDISTFF